MWEWNIQPLSFWRENERGEGGTNRLPRKHLEGGPAVRSTDFRGQAGTNLQGSLASRDQLTQQTDNGLQGHEVGKKLKLCSLQELAQLKELNGKNKTPRKSYNRRDPQGWNSRSLHAKFEE